MKKLFLLLCVLSLSISVSAQCDWTQRVDLPGNDRYECTGFSIAGEGYIGLGSNPTLTYYPDFWKYSPNTNTWSQIASFPGTARSGCFSFVINNIAYVGAGKSNPGSGWIYYNELYSYNPTTNTWTQLGNLPFTVKSPTYFAINNKGYVLCGVESGVATDNVWEYNPASDSWTQKNDFPGGARAGMLSFTTSDRAFVGTGGDASGSTSYSDFWEYNYLTDTWTQKTNFPGNQRNFAVGIALQEKWCVIMSGRETTTNNFLNDVWSYNITSDSWTQEQNFPGSARYAAVAFTVDNTKAYFGTGATGPGAVSGDYWEFTPGNANIPQAASNSPVCVGSQLNLYASAIPGATYEWTGPNGFTSTQQNPVVSASATTNMSGTYYVTSNLYGCTSAAGFLTIDVNDAPPTTPVITLSGPNLYSSSSTGNQWYDQNGIISGATNYFYPITDNGSYYVVVTNGCGSATSNTIVITNAGFESFENNATVYPNPASDFVTIELTSAGQNASLNIYDVYGQLIRISILDQRSSAINISDLNPGLYFFEITEDSGQTGTYCISKQ